MRKCRGFKLNAGFAGITSIRFHFPDRKTPINYVVDLV